LRPGVPRTIACAGGPLAVEVVTSSSVIRAYQPTSVSEIQRAQRRKGLAPSPPLCASFLALPIASAAACCHETCGSMALNLHKFSERALPARQSRHLRVSQGIAVVSSTVFARAHGVSVTTSNAYRSHQMPRKNYCWRGRQSNFQCCPKAHHALSMRAKARLFERKPGA